MIKSFLLVLLLVLTSCSSSPVLYPNKRYEKVGKAIADGDIDKCMGKADKFLASKKGKKILKGAGKGSIIGGVVGVVTGALSGNIVRGATHGAAIGAAAGGASAGVSRDQLRESFVNRCLRRKGYEVIGWE
ncbi:cell envelope biogenesis protein OmpA [Halobacteriovorax marinus]|uniref:Cell envelope biogenesis protein OmpA n=1 Tax=Halobacteriovorax marinus TaxID=97084 RepID=A0A1Y5FEA5_9BACT|nr:cell envelope biogenesis protein OmpA [Halobacteriovorax marinus]